MAITALSALAHQTRLEAFRLLIKAGPHGVPAGTIAERLGVRQNTLSSHLALLHQAGLIRSQREGRSIRYSANYQCMQALVAFLLKDCCQADGLEGLVGDPATSIQ